MPPGQSFTNGPRPGRRPLRLLAALVQLGFLGAGFAVFLDQSRALLSDAQFTQGERTVMGLVALVSLGGCGLAGWVAGRLIAVAADALDSLADAAESARRTAELLDLHVVPALRRIAAAVESLPTDDDRGEPPARTRPARP